MENVSASKGETGASRTSRSRANVIPAPRNLQRCSWENLRKASRTCFSISFAAFSGSKGVWSMTNDAKSVLYTESCTEMASSN